MGKKKENKTNAIRLLEQRNIPYAEYHYTWSDDDLSASPVVSQLPEKNESQIFKTLVLVGNRTGPLVAVIPSNQEVDLKKLAKVSDNKKVELLHLSELEKMTGYIRGGCSPVGMKKSFPTFIEASAKTFDEIIVSAGRRGLQMGVAPQALLKVTKGKFVSII